MKKLNSILAILSLVIVIGCGGGGVGGSSTSSPIALALGGCPVLGETTNVTYSTSWGTAPTTASQIVEFLGSDGSIVRTQILNRASGNSVVLSGMSSAVYSVRATLKSAINGTGTTLGVSQQTVNLCSTRANEVTVQTSNESTPDTSYVSFSGPLTINGGNVEVTKGLNLNVFPTFLKGTVPTFYDPAQVTYTITNSVGTIATNQFSATTVGLGTVTAKLPSVTKANPTNVNVTSGGTKSKWTVLVYINAANDLYSFSTLNMNQMEQVAGNASNVRFVVQWKQSTSEFAGSSFDGTRRYLVKPDNTNNIASQLLTSNMTEGNGTPLDMGKASNLLDFIKWGKANFPADRYALVIWNHGNGWRRDLLKDLPTRGFSYDDQSNNSIQTWQMDQALGTEKFDIIAWDCSLMQMTEIAYEMRNNTDYVVGSEESPPGEGYPYNTVFAPFRDTPDASSEVLARSFVDATLAVPEYASRKITQSVVRTSTLPNLVTALDSLAVALNANQQAVKPTLEDIRVNGKSFSFATNYRYYFDVIDICQRLEAVSSTPQAVKTAAANVRAVFPTTVIHEGHNANSAGSNGLALDLSTGSYFSSAQGDYRLLKFAKDTRWDEFLLGQP